MKTQRKQKGSLAITTLLIASSILVLTGTVLVITSADFFLTLKNSATIPESIPVTQSCIEDGMRKIKKNRAYTGTYTVTISGKSCVNTVENDQSNSNIKNITIAVTLSNNTYTTVKKVDVSGTLLSIIE